MSRDNENMFPYSPSIIDTEAKHFREIKMKKSYIFPVANTLAITQNRLSLRLSPIKKCLKCTHSSPFCLFGKDLIIKEIVSNTTFHPARFKEKSQPKK